MEGLIIAVDNLNEVIRLIRSSKTPKEAREKLMQAFSLTEIQAQAILDMSLQRLTNLEVLALRKEYEELQKRIEMLRGILASEKKLMNVIKKELKEIRDAYADPRRTEIAPSFEQIVVEEEKPVADEAAVVLSRNGFVKRMQPRVYDRAEQQELPKCVLKTMTDAKLLFFTDRGNCYPIAVEAIPEAKPKDRGLALGGLLAGLDHEERVVAMMEAGDWSGEWLFVTEGGMAKRTDRSDFNVRKSKFAAINLRDGDALLTVLDPAEFDSALLISESGMAIHFAIEEVSKVGRTAAGVKAMTLAAGDRVAHAFVHRSEGEVILISELGYMKRCLLIDFDRQARGGKGVRSFNFLKNGANGTKIAGALIVRDPIGFRIVQKSGAFTPVNSEEVAIESKAGRGTPYVVVVMDDVVVELQR